MPSTTRCYAKIDFQDVDVGSVKLPLSFLPVKTPFDPLPNFIVDPINTPLLITSVVGTTTDSAHMVVIPNQVIG
jgi:hypothetical protein